MALVEISGTLSGTVIEDSIFDAYGATYISGGGATGEIFFPGEFAGIYGELTVVTSGEWQYTLTNSLSTVQSLAENTESHDYFIISLGDGSLKGLIDILVQGSNDSAAFGGDLTNYLNVASAASVSGQIEIFDIDTDEKQFNPVMQAGTFGTLSLDKDGAWQYILLPGQQTAIQDELKNGVDTFMVSSVDGTLVSVAIQVFSATESIIGSSGNDILTGGSGNEIMDGDAGIDTAIFSGNCSDCTITPTATGFTLSGGGNGIDTLSNIERLSFADGFLAFDIDGNAGKVYRLYKAAFDRTPDTPGLGYWIKEFDAGANTMLGIANGFIASTEFQTLYGSASTVTDRDFITLLYNNVLDRTPDQAGFDYWEAEISRGFTREAFLTSFSESAENIANVVGVISNGIWYV